MRSHVTGNEDILPSVDLHIPEFFKSVVDRLPYYYPQTCQRNVYRRDQSGAARSKAWIAIEDIHDGWERSDTLGQEVYGTGVAFDIMPRHFFTENHRSFIDS